MRKSTSFIAYDRSSTPLIGKFIYHQGPGGQQISLAKKLLPIGFEFCRDL
jgi:hypothetical protein